MTDGDRLYTVGEINQALAAGLFVCAASRYWYRYRGGNVQTCTSGGWNDGNFPFPNPRWPAERFIWTVHTKGPDGSTVVPQASSGTTRFTLLEVDWIDSALKERNSEVKAFILGQIISPSEVPAALHAGHMVMRRPDESLIHCFWEMREGALWVYNNTNEWEPHRYKKPENIPWVMINSGVYMVVR